MDLNSDQIARLVYLLLILSSIGGWLVVSIKQDFSRTIQRALIWALIFLGFFGVYGIWEDIAGGFRAEDQFTKITDSVFQIEKSSDGHFYTTAKINNKTITFLIDTGATKTVLSLKDAKLAGIPISKLNFANPIQTANGISYSASYQIKNFFWFERNFEKVDIQIIDGKLFSSLLGMDIISDAETFLISGDVLQLSFK